MHVAIRRMGLARERRTRRLIPPSIGLVLRLGTAFAAAAAAALLVGFAVHAQTGGAGGDTGWKPLRPSLLKRGEAAAATVGDRVYVAGGFLAPAGETTNKVERYDPRRDQWDLVRPMPVALNHPSAVAYAGDLYVLGGYTGGVSNPGVPTGGVADASNAFLRYDPATNTWSRMPSIPEARSAAAAVVIGHRLYVAGGRNRLPTYATSEGLLKSLYIFDFRSGRWSRGPDMSIAREHIAGAAAGGAFYVLGGRLMFDSTAAVERYLPGQRRWQRVADMRVPHNGFGAVAVAGRIVAFGGEEPSNRQFRNDNPFTELFDPPTGRWTALANMRTPRGAVAAAAVGRRIYAIEGVKAPPNTSCCQFTDIVEVLDLPDTTPPRIQTRGVPRRCTCNGFTLTVSIHDESRLRQASVALDGRRIRTTRQKRFAVRISARRLRPGRHSLRISATDVAGNRAAVTRTFRRCGGARLTG